MKKKQRKKPSKPPLSCCKSWRQKCKHYLSKPAEYVFICQYKKYSKSLQAGRGPKFCARRQQKIICSTALPYHTKLYHKLLYHTLLYHTIPYHTIPYHTIPYHTILYPVRDDQMSSLKLNERTTNASNASVHSFLLLSEARREKQTISIFS